MKKLFFFLLALTFPVLTMERPRKKRPYTEVASQKIKYTQPKFDKNIPLLVIKAKEKGIKTPIGTVMFDKSHKNDNIGHIYELKVDPGYQGKGIGYQLFARAITELQKQGYPKVSWLAFGTDPLNPLPLNKLENIYIKMVCRLAAKIDCDLEIGPRRIETYEKTPFLLTFKNQNQQISTAPYYSPMRISEDGKNFSLSAFHGQNIIGFIQFRQDPVDDTIGEILHLYVDPLHRNKGIGYRLFKNAVLEFAKNNYVSVTFLSMQMHDTSARTLENIFSKMAHKLKNEIQCILLMKDRLKLGKTATQEEKLITPMQIKFKK